MSSWWQTLTVAVVGVAILWLALVTVFWALNRRRTDHASLRDALRLIPDVTRLLARLASDRALPSGVRSRVVLLLAYLALPIDLVPDLIPVVGYADDVILVALVLRSVVRRAGTDAVDRHWPGTPEGLSAVKRLAGIHTAR